jgi:hypothetical protein
MQLTNSNDVTFKVVLDNDIVKIYDTRYDFTMHGQFVSDYYVDTILEMENDGRGLDLYGGIRDWFLTSENVLSLQEFLKNS